MKKITVIPKGELSTAGEVEEADNTSTEDAKGAKLCLQLGGKMQNDEVCAVFIPRS